MKNNAKLTILQINDTHGYLEPHLEWMAGPHQPVYRAAGGFARVGTLVRKIREETQGRVLFCDNGDTFHVTHPIVHSRGEILVPILKCIVRLISRCRGCRRNTGGSARISPSTRTRPCSPISTNTNPPAPNCGAPSWPTDET